MYRTPYVFITRHASPVDVELYSVARSAGRECVRMTHRLGLGAVPQSELGSISSPNRCSTFSWFPLMMSGRPVNMLTREGQVYVRGVYVSAITGAPRTCELSQVIAA